MLGEWEEELQLKAVLFVRIIRRFIMKKLFIFLLFITHLNTFAFTGGVKGGINYTIPQAKSGYEEHFSNDYGYTLGGFLSFNLIDKLFLNTELMLNSWQFKYDEEDYGEEIMIITEKANFNFIELTLALSYNFFDNFYFDLGIFLGIQAYFKSSFTDITGEYQNITIAKHNTTPSSGINISLGYKYNKFLLNIRYLFDVSPFLSGYVESCELLTSSCYFDKFNQFQLLIGYEF